MFECSGPQGPDLHSQQPTDRDIMKKNKKLIENGFNNKLIVTTSRKTQIINSISMIA